MTRKIFYLLGVFLGGVLVGSGITLLIDGKKMEKRIEEEVADVRRTYARISVAKASADDIETDQELAHSIAQDVAKKNSEEKAKMITSSNQIIMKERYNLFKTPPPDSLEDETEEEDEDDEDDIYADIVDVTPPSEGVADSPYVISMSAFINEEIFFDKTTLNYYDDGILEDELTEEIIEDVDAVVGRESLTKFGEYEDDVVFVRNERLRTDYEIVRQHRNFAEFPDEDSP